jgi:hypothetical protein
MRSCVRLTDPVPALIRKPELPAYRCKGFCPLCMGLNSLSGLVVCPVLPGSPGPGEDLPSTWQVGCVEYARINAALPGRSIDPGMHAGTAGALVHGVDPPASLRVRPAPLAERQARGEVPFYRAGMMHRARA